jgi:arylsulfatase A-like enzyme
MSWRRNLLIFLAHGLRSDVISDGSPSGYWPLSTPNLLKMSQRGLHVIASAASPSDPGAMATLLTGLHARQHGCLEPSAKAWEVEGFAHWLKEAGYFVAGVGCVGAMRSALDASVIVGDVNDPEPMGCDYLHAAKMRGVALAVVQQRKQRLRSGLFEPDRLLMEPEHDIDGFITAEAVKMMERLPGGPGAGVGDDTPWAMIVGFSGPGNDLPPPPLYEGIVSPRVLERGFVPADFRGVDALAELDLPRTMLQRLEPWRVGRMRADYLGRVSLVDFGVGQVVNAMQQRPDVTRTWCVLASDRGCLLGEHGLFGHRSFLCPAIETPLLVRAPRATRVPPSDVLVSTVDVAATIAALAGADVPAAVAAVGRSLLPLMSDEAREDKDMAALAVPEAPGGGLVSEFGTRLMLETKRHKVVFDVRNHQVLGLYDLLNDPEERENLAEKMTGRNLLDALKWRVGEALMPLRVGVGATPGAGRAGAVRMT